MNDLFRLDDNYFTRDMVGEFDCSDSVLADMLRAQGYSPRRLKALLSDAASRSLESIATAARLLTLQRFGRAKQLYVPLYVSNYCRNNCKYCGFSTEHKFERTRITVEQAVEQGEIIASEGFRHILLLSGEDPRHASVEFFAQLASKLRKSFAAIDIEIYPCSTDQYKKLFDAGIDGITIYQETYDPVLYSELHTKGPKKDYYWRLDTPQMAAEAGFRRIGIGTLLGLGDWRRETLALAEHCAFLMKRYWKSQVSVSFPRIRPAEQVLPDFVEFVPDEALVKMMFALRLCFPDVGIVLSTRESREFRNHLIDICVTKLSAGSKTNPGGYGNAQPEAVEQFCIDDSRTPAEMEILLKTMGYEAVWKDWDSGFSISKS